VKSSSSQSKVMTFVVGEQLTACFARLSRSKKGPESLDAKTI
jgi:hypothetical protein